MVLVKLRVSLFALNQSWTISRSDSMQYFRYTDFCDLLSGWYRLQIAQSACTEDLASSHCKRLEISVV